MRLIKSLDYSDIGASRPYALCPPSPAREAFMLCPHAVHLARTNHRLLWLLPTLPVSQVVLIILNSLFPPLPRSICSVPGYLSPVPWSEMAFLKWVEVFRSHPFIYSISGMRSKSVERQQHRACAHSGASQMRPANPQHGLSSCFLGVASVSHQGHLASSHPVALFLIPGGPSLTDGLQFFTTGPSSLLPPDSSCLSSDKTQMLADVYGHA